MTQILNSPELRIVTDAELQEPGAAMAQAERLLEISQQMMNQFPEAAIRLPESKGGPVRPEWSLLALTNESRRQDQDTFIHLSHRLGEPGKVERVKIMTSHFRQGHWAGRLLVDASTDIGVDDGFQVFTRKPIQGRSLKTGQNFDPLQAYRLGRRVGDRLSGLMLDGARVSVSLERTREVARQHNLIREA